MDAHSFDTLLRIWQARGTRRAIGRGLLATLLGGAVSPSALDGTLNAKKKRKKRRKGGKQPAACLPSCSGKTCGDDGCGGTCGSCALCRTCQDGQCAPAASDPGCGGQCRACLEGLCVQNVNGASCTEVANGRCQAGICQPTTN